MAGCTLTGFVVWPWRSRALQAHYRGMLEDGTVFDSSYGRGRPLTIMVGVGEVIKGWDLCIAGGEGIPPMRVGTRRLSRAHVVVL